MSDGTDVSRSNPAESGNSQSGGMWFRLLLLVCLLVAIVYAGNAALQTMHARDAEQETEAKTVQSSGLIAPTPKVLASMFTDSQGRLLADPPSSASQLVNPDSLVVSHITGTEENPGTNWKEFEKHLADVTGKQVVDREYDNSADQLAQISKGEITILALHPADAPFLVNNYGFQPIAVLGTDNGANGNHLDIIVPASSSINSAADLKGHSLVCTVPASITGYRAAVALLMSENGLRPNVDYMVTWSMGQKRSIMGLIKGDYDAAAVSDDRLQSLIDDGKIQKSQFKVVYQSPVIPRTTIGWFYNLNPALADKVREAILSFKPTGSTAVPAADDETADASTTQSLHFLPIDYKKDFQLVRTIDDSFDPRLDAKAHQKESATTQPSAS
jgi:phosphonate transport system substrate-binding protein